MRAAVADGSSPQFRRLARQARWIWALSGISFYVVMALTAVAALVLAEATRAVGFVVAGTVLLCAHWWIITGRRYRSWGYAEEERDLIIRRGVLVRRTSVVPYGRMQFVDVTEGPLARLLGLAEVKLHTAAAATDARIPFLPVAEAHRLRLRLTELGEAHAAGL